MTSRLYSLHYQTILLDLHTCCSTGPMRGTGFGAAALQRAIAWASVLMCIFYDLWEYGNRWILAIWVQYKGIWNGQDKSGFISAGMCLVYLKLTAKRLDIPSKEGASIWM
jgi:hypothetical protein